MCAKKFKKIGPTRLPCLLADSRVVTFKLYMYRFLKKRDYYVLEKGDIRNSENPLVRIHSACSFANVFNCQKCDCKFQLNEAMIKLAENKTGLIIYAWCQEGRSIGKWDHVRAYMEQDKGEDTVTSYEVLGLPVDKRNYSDAVEILKDYGIKEVRLLTNNPKKITPVEKAGIKVTRIPLIAKLHKYNESQIKIKLEKLGHYYNIEKNEK